MADLGNGARVRSSEPAQGQEGWIWVMLDGTKRAMAQDSYRQMYRDDNNVQDLPQAELPGDGAEISEAYLAQDDAEDKTYVVADGKKYLVTSSEAIEKYRFSKGNAKPTPHADLEAMATAGEINN